ncbi:MAG: cupredoxin domain-containing protein, partial [Thaumarchaeota archaeon]|nr:cupredoxin domain-containing protein [Nitrososphaerota archaeon]
GVADASIHIPSGSLVSLHFINEDKDNKSPMDLNIDEFKVHTNNLGYFQAQTINFVADKTGTFSYYSNLHPEMKGTITVDP